MTGMDTSAVEGVHIMGTVTDEYDRGTWFTIRGRMTGDCNLAPLIAKPGIGNSDLGGRKRLRVLTTISNNYSSEIGSHFKESVS